jgi:mannose-6-phosphate isomerase-like protein (cupin superfamily)
MRYVFNTEHPKRYRFPTHINDLVMDRSEASCTEVFIVILGPGESPPLHQHDDFEQVYYVLDGHGRLEIGSEGETYPVNPGDVVRIPPSTRHRIYCLGDAELKYLAIDSFPGGRPSDEPTWDDHIMTVCQQLGWDYSQIVDED